MNVSMRGLSALAVLLAAIPAIAHAEDATVVLRLKERVPVEQLARNAAALGVTYTPDQIRRICGPTDADYARFIASLRAKDMQIVSETRTHLFVTVRGDKEMLEQRLLDRAPYSRNSLIAGFSTSEGTAKRMPRYRILGPVRSMMSRADNGISPETIKTAYNFNPIYASGLSGAGQQIAIATYDDFRLQDVQDFYQKIGLKNPPQVDKVTFNGTPTLNDDSALETELDSEFSGMIAPGAKIHVFTSAENSDAGELAMFTKILDDNRSKVVNYSWGSCESMSDPQHLQNMDKVLAQAVAQGINIMVASGDSGAQGCQYDTTKQADWPAADPHVVAVGGTTLVNNGKTFETAWNGSGGGVSSVFDLPSWQAGFQSPFVRRSFPDVAFNADYQNSGQGIWATYQGSAGWIVIGGTSMAAPQWSGFLALVGQARSEAKLPTLGFLNPRIYALDASTRASTFHDVISGSNGQDGAEGYSANAGWDAVTGWGSMNAAQLLKALTAN